MKTCTKLGWLALAAALALMLLPGCRNCSLAVWRSSAACGPGDVQSQATIDRGATLSGSIPVGP